VRSWAGIAFAALALTHGLAAMPVAIVSNLHLGAGLAGIGVLLGAFAMFTAVLRGRGRGFWLSLVSTAVCVVGLILLGTGTWGRIRFTSGEGGFGDSVLDWLAESTPPDPEMMRYLPSNSQLVYSIQARAVAKSEVFRELSRRLPELRKLETALEEGSGLPPSQLTRVMIGGRVSRDPLATEFVCVCWTKSAVTAADILANMKDANYREEKVGKFTMHTKQETSFCVAEKDVVLFGPPAIIRKTLLREGSPELSSGLRTAIRAADFSRSVVIAGNAKDVLRKDSGFGTTGVAGWTQELTDATIRANAAVVIEFTFKEAMEWRQKTCCKDRATAEELKRLQDEAIETIKADPNTPKPLLKVLASAHRSLDESKIVETGSIDVDTILKLVQQDHEAVREAAHDDKAGAPANAPPVADGKKDTPLRPGQALDKRKIQTPTDQEKIVKALLDRLDDLEKAAGNELLVDEVNKKHEQALASWKGKRIELSLVVEGVGRQVLGPKAEDSIFAPRQVQKEGERPWVVGVQPIESVKRQAVFTVPFFVRFRFLGVDEKMPVPVDYTLRGMDGIVLQDTDRDLALARKLRPGMRIVVVAKVEEIRPTSYNHCDAVLFLSDVKLEDSKAPK
jgi:hypothetical protein